MAQHISPFFGRGVDGDLVISSNTTDTPIDASCAGTIATTSLFATNAFFAAGQLILIHQTQGANAGQWELNRIASYSTGTITTALPLTYGYTTGAQVIVVREYDSYTIQSNQTLTCKQWTGSVGGIFAVAVAGTFRVDGILNLTGQGFRGGLGDNVTGRSYGDTGESSSGASIPNQQAANGNAGGGGQSIGDAGNGGGGGSHGTAGQAGLVGNQGGLGGAAGGTGSPANDPTLTLMTFGGGGGGGGIDDSTNGGNGGRSGGGFFVFAKIYKVTGHVNFKGGNGTSGGDSGGGGGGGSGGFGFVKCNRAELGIDKHDATGGTGALGNSAFGGIGGNGGNGGKGRFRLECNSYTGSINALYAEISIVQGGRPWAGKLGPSA